MGAAFWHARLPVRTQSAKLEQYVGPASLALALLAALIAALFLGTSWFRSNSSRMAAHISRVASLIGSSDTLRQFQKCHPGAWEFIIHRFEAGEYLGLHLTIGLVVSVAALWLFGGVTEDVIHHDPLTQFDVTLLEWFQAHTTNSGMQIFAAISSLGSPLVMTALGLAVALALAVRRSWLVLFGWAGALGGAGVLDALLKHNLRRPRPIYASAFLHSYSFSFPSGHAMGSLVGYGMLAYLLLSSWTHRWQVRVAIVSIAALLTLAIGVSRLYLGVHYFSDVVGGYAASVLWLSAYITGREIARRQPHSQGPKKNAEESKQRIHGSPQAPLLASGHAGRPLTAYSLR